MQAHFGVDETVTEHEMLCGQRPRCISRKKVVGAARDRISALRIGRVPISARFLLRVLTGCNGSTDGSGSGVMSFAELFCPTL